MQTSRARRTLLLCLVLLLALPAATHAATLTGGGVLAYAAGAAETNHVTVSNSGCTTAPCLRIVDTGPGVTMTIPGSCTAIANGAECPVPAQLTVDLGDSDDTFTDSSTGTTTSTQAQCDLQLGAGEDTATLGASIHQVCNTAGNDTVTGSDHADTFIGSSGNEIFHGGDGNDTFDGGGGVDGWDGEGGTDTEDFSWASGPVRVVGTSVTYGGVGIGSTGGAETLVLGPSADVVSGSGATAIHGAGGSDVIHAAPGVVASIFGEGGNDTFYGATGTQYFYGGDGTDTMSYDYVGRGGVFVCLASLSLCGTPYDGSGTPDKDIVGSDVEHVIGSSGSGANDWDQLVAGNALSELWGGNGDDDLLPAPGMPLGRLHGGPGIDAADFSFPPFHPGALVLKMSALNSDMEGVIGTAKGDRVTGRGGFDVIYGIGGKDKLNGGGGGDYVDGGDGNDTIIGGRGWDYLVGGTGNDHVVSRDGRRDDVDCGAGKDTVIADRKDKVKKNCEHVKR